MFLLSKAYALPRRPIQPLLSRGKRYRRAKKGIMVRLLQDVPDLGRAGSVMEVDKVVMRAWLFPERQAEYIVRPRGGYRPEDLMSYEIAPAVVEVEQVTEPEAPTLHWMLPVLRSLPPLTFRRRPISPTANGIFGSVTQQNILAVLENEYSIVLKQGDATVELIGEIVELGRIKQLGTAKCKISIVDVGEAELSVIVRAQGTGAETTVPEVPEADVVWVNTAPSVNRTPVEAPAGGVTRTQ